MHTILRIIYKGTTLTILSYAAQDCIECLSRNNNATKLKRVHRLIKIKIEKTFRTTSYGALSVLTGITRILIEMGKLAMLNNITRGNEQGAL
jgi:hypothetical protein